MFLLWTKICSCAFVVMKMYKEEPVIFKRPIPVNDISVCSDLIEHYVESDEVLLGIY